MRKGRDGGKKTGKKEEKTDENSGHYVIASSRPLERRTLAPKTNKVHLMIIKESKESNSFIFFSFFFSFLSSGKELL